MNLRRSALPAVAALAVVYVVWGSTYLGILVAIESLPPFVMAFLRFGLAGALLFAWSIRRGDAAGDRPTRRQWGSAALLGGLLLVGGNGAVTWAEQFISSGLAALLIATLPLWMAVFARLLEGQRLAAQAVVGLVLGFAGVALLVRPTAGASTLIGTFAVLGGAMSWAWGSLWSRRLDLPSRPLVATSMQMLMAAAIFAVLATLGGEWGRVDPAAVSGRSLAALAYLVVFGSILAFSAYVWLLRNVRTSVVSTYAFVNPVVAVMLGWSIAGELVDTRMLVAGGIVVLAVALIVTAPKRVAAAVPRRFDRTLVDRTAT